MGVGNRGDIDPQKLISPIYALSHYWFVCLMLFNTTFNNISVISWLSVLLVEEAGGPGENHRLTNFLT
jgi:hypothetical protein